jgi:hypothetical protein
MKNIKTLVEDIYSLFDLSALDMPEEEVDKYIEEFGDMVKLHTKKFLYAEESVDKKLRLSQIGKPDRQLWFDINSDKVRANLTSSTRIKFLYGYILEEFLLMCAAIAGHDVKDQQKEVSVGGVVGHQDCIIDGVLVDVKSASSSAFKKFKSNRLLEDDPFGYIAQISAYAQANGLKEAAFLAIDKSTGEIVLTPVHSMEFVNAEARIKHLKGMVISDTVPDLCYDPVPDGKSGNFKLPIGCVFCSHKRECWSNANGGKGIRVFEYAQGKRYLVQVGKEPDVPEVIDW